MASVAWILNQLNQIKVTGQTFVPPIGKKCSTHYTSPWQFMCIGLVSKCNILNKIRLNNKYG